MHSTQAKVTGFFASCALLLVYAYLYIFFGLGNDLISERVIMLSAGALASIAGFIFQWRDRKYALRAYGISIALILSLLAYQSPDEQVQRNISTRKQAESYRAENEWIFANALSKAPCDNGDIAVLMPSPHDADIVSLKIIPADRTQQSLLIAFSRGDLISGPETKAMEAYKKRTKTECRNKDYPSLEYLMAYLQKHYSDAKARRP